ncbi:MAG: DNA topoisomerase IV subunit A, partial [Alphaproteobacteria bacterium]|nr:DNA topoisomerase IV subunit A [Alphaproteobacteria bacterium]
AYLNLDEVIRIIREEDEPKAVLMATFKLTDNQAEAILNMKLRNLRKLDEEQIRAEDNEFKEEKTRLLVLVNSEDKRWLAIAEEIKRIKEKYGKKTAIGRRRTDFSEPPAEIEVPVEAWIEKEPITVILSQKGWIRCLKGYSDLNESFKFKDDDTLAFALHAQTTDKIVMLDNKGKFFSINANDIPSGRGFGQPVRLMIDLANSDEVVAMFVYEPKANYLVASDKAYGFIVDENHILAQTRNGRKIMNVADNENVKFCIKMTGDYVAIVGDNRKLLVFKAEEIPSMARGHGVLLQKYRDGHITDIQIFNGEEGFSYNRAGGVSVEKELITWLGHRAQVGKTVPFGFPKNNKFLK